MISDPFNGTWKAADSTLPVTFDITVPAVRPDHKTHGFVEWGPVHLTDGCWRPKLHPPADDPHFDFSGESLQEMDSPGSYSWVKVFEIGQGHRQGRVDRGVR